MIDDVKIVAAIVATAILGIAAVFMLDVGTGERILMLCIGVIAALGGVEAYRPSRR